MLPPRWKKKASPSVAKKMAIMPVGLSLMKLSERSTTCEEPYTLARRTEGRCRLVSAARMGRLFSVRMSKGSSARALWPSHIWTRSLGTMPWVVNRRSFGASWSGCSGRSDMVDTA